MFFSISPKTNNKKNKNSVRCYTLTLLDDAAVNFYFSFKIFFSLGFE